MTGDEKGLEELVQDSQALEEELAAIFHQFEEATQRPFDAEDDEGTSRFLGPYQLLERLGEGGVARVMRGRHIHPRYADHALAIKILQEELSKDPHVIDLFRNEAYVLSQLKHPNLVSTFEAGEQDGNLFIAMEQIHGHDLDNLLFRCQKLDQSIPIPIAMFIVGEVLKGLIFAHELQDGYGTPMNLIHRDVNPANVFVSYQGGVKLGDFGIAKIAAGRLERVREVAGKAGYFAPEQLEGWTVDQRTDLFSMGVMMFELLCGLWLFDDRDTGRMISQNRKAKIPKPRKYNDAIPKELEKIILKALKRKAKDRYQTARDLYAAIQPYIPHPEASRLSLSSMMRNVFSLEYTRRMETHFATRGNTSRMETSYYVALAARNEQDVQAFHKLLKAQNYDVGVATSPQSLHELTVARVPSLFLLAASNNDESLKSYQEVVERYPDVPVIVITDSYSSELALNACELGAQDIFSRPYRLTRVTMAIRAALQPSLLLSDAESPSLTFATDFQPRVALVTSDNHIAGELALAFEDAGLMVELVPTEEEVLQRAAFCSYHAVVWDNLEGKDWGFIQAYRSRPGMAAVPFLCLLPNRISVRPEDPTPNQVIVHSRNENADLLAQSFSSFKSDGIMGRSFTRYPISVDISLRYGGRVFEAIAGDLSRGGVLLYCAQIPPVGIEVGVALKFPKYEAPIEVVGRVVRVDLSRRHGDSRTGIGIEFTRFAPQCEEQLIEVIQTLEPIANQRRSAVLGFSKL